MLGLGGGTISNYQSFDLRRLLPRTNRYLLAPDFYLHPSPLFTFIYTSVPVPLRLRFTPSFPLAGSGGGNFRSQGDKMTMKEMTPERAYRNYVNNGMRIVVDNGVLKGIIRDW